MTADLNNINSVNLKWDPKNLEIRTRTVEKTLEPLVIQVSELLLILFICMLVSFGEKIAWHMQITCCFIL